MPLPGLAQASPGEVVMLFELVRGELLQQGEGLVQGLGFELCALPEPSRIEPVILAASAAMVVDIFGDSIDQAPGGITGCLLYTSPSPRDS